MGRKAWGYVLVLMCAVVCISAIPQPDLPETSYNEVDTPVNQTPPVVPSLRLVRPAVVPAILPRQVWVARYGTDVQEQERNSTPPTLWRDPRALREGYLEALDEYLTEVRRGCTRIGIDYHLVRTGDYLDAVLTKFLHHRMDDRAAPAAARARGPQ